MGAEASAPGARGVDVSLATSGGKRWWTGVGLGGNWATGQCGSPAFTNVDVLLYMYSYMMLYVDTCIYMYIFMYIIIIIHNSLYMYSVYVCIYIIYV